MRGGQQQISLPTTEERTRRLGGDIFRRSRGRSKNATIDYGAETGVSASLAEAVGTDSMAATPIHAATGSRTANTARTNDMYDSGGGVALDSATPAAYKTPPRSPSSARHRQCPGAPRGKRRQFGRVSEEDNDGMIQNQVANIGIAPKRLFE